MPPPSGSLTSPRLPPCLFPLALSLEGLAQSFNRSSLCAPPAFRRFLLPGLATGSKTNAFNSELPTTNSSLPSPQHNSLRTGQSPRFPVAGHWSLLSSYRFPYRTVFALSLFASTRSKPYRKTTGRGYTPALSNEGPHPPKESHNEIASIHCF